MRYLKNYNIFSIAKVLLISILFAPNIEYLNFDKFILFFFILIFVTLIIFNSSLFFNFKYENLFFTSIILLYYAKSYLIFGIYDFYFFYKILSFGLIIWFLYISFSNQLDHQKIAKLKKFFVFLILILGILAISLKLLLYFVDFRTFFTFYSFERIFLQKRLFTFNYGGTGLSFIFALCYLIILNNKFFNLTLTIIFKFFLIFCAYLSGKTGLFLIILYEVIYFNYKFIYKINTKYYFTFLIVIATVILIVTASVFQIFENQINIIFKSPLRALEQFKIIDATIIEIISGKLNRNFQASDSAFIYLIQLLGVPVILMFIHKFFLINLAKSLKKNNIELNLLILSSFLYAFKSNLLFDIKLCIILSIIYPILEYKKL